MWPFKRKTPQLELLALAPELLTVDILKPAASLRREWLDAVRADLKRDTATTGFDRVHNGSVARCPGIMGVLSAGYILYTWQDVEITTNGDGESFSWVSACDQQKLFGIQPAIEPHAKEQLAAYMQNWPSHTLRTFVKICFPWRLKVPKGFQLLIQPVPYADVHHFSAAPGIIPADLSYAPLNINLYWHATNATVFLPAGTPLAHLLLIPQKQPVVTAVLADIDKTEAYQHAVHSSFVPRYNEVRKFIRGLS